MTEILESSINDLKIIYKRSLTSRIIYSALALMFLSVAAFTFFGNVKPEPDAEYPDFALIALLLIGTLMLAFSLLFFAAVFDTANYYFDKTADKFYLTGRRNFFRKWAVEGAVSDIIGVSCEIYGNDESRSSEIFLKYSFSGTLAETIKCGTGENTEDEIIADYIKSFLEPKKIIS